jgi:hypothetical protein
MPLCPRLAGGGGAAPGGDDHLGAEAGDQLGDDQAGGDELVAVEVRPGRRRRSP